MGNQKYEIEKHSVDTILSWIKTKEVVIPEIQRPFVWKAVQVRNLIDSLYNGYPVGYLIVSRSHDLKLKDGTISKGQRILIDGQQRVTALTAAILGRTVLNKEYQERPIRIAYNPFAKEEENAFEVQDQSHLKSKRWIDDISIFFDDKFPAPKIAAIYVGKKCSDENIHRIVNWSKEYGFDIYRQKDNIENLALEFEKLN